MIGVPRKIRQGLTLWVIAIGSCAWWYQDTGSKLFLGLLLLCGVGGAFELWKHFRAIRNGSVDPQGFTTVVGRLTKSEDVVLLFFFAFAPLAQRAYVALRANALVPPQPHDIVISLPVWFTFSAVTTCFAAWVVESKERWFWVIATVFLLTYGVWQLTISQSMRPVLSEVAWGVNNLTVLLLAVYGWWLYTQMRQAQH
jgi:hypothetical protein